MARDPEAFRHRAGVVSGDQRRDRLPADHTRSSAIASRWIDSTSRPDSLIRFNRSRHRSRSRAVATFRRYPKVIDYRVFEPSSPIAVRLSGDSAALRFQVSFDLVVGGDTHVTHQGWITELYERRHGRWQIVWEQATAIPNDFGLFVESIKPVS